MRPGRGLLCSLAAGVWSSVAMAQVRAPAPVATLIAGGRLVISRLPPILGDDEVKKHLMTGLTTTFVLEVTARGSDGSKVAGGAQIAIRYDLWDEQFVVTALDASRTTHEFRAPGIERLQDWWRAGELEVAEHAELAGGGPGRVSVSLAVLPFSHTEQLDAQRWLADSLREPGRPQETSPGSGQGHANPGPAPSLLSGLVATSVARRSVLTYRWTVPLGTAAPP